MTAMTPGDIIRIMERAGYTNRQIAVILVQCGFRVANR